MNNKRKFPKGTSRDIPKENYYNEPDVPYRYTPPQSQFLYNQWNPQGSVYNYDQYGYYPEQESIYNNEGMAMPFVGEQVVSTSPKAKQSGKKKIKLEYIAGRNKRNVTFSKRKKGIMKKAYELNVLTGTEILLLVASESGHVYTFATPKLRPIIMEHENIIQGCLHAQDPVGIDGLHESTSLSTTRNSCHSTYSDEYNE